MKINSYVLSLALLATPNHPAFVSAQEPCPYGDGNFEAITAFNHGQYYDLPACATSCVGGAQGGIGCSNANCACSNLNQYWSYVSSCIDESCTPSAAMLSNALQLVAPFCNSVGGCYGFTPPAVTSMSTTFCTLIRFIVLCLVRRLTCSYSYGYLCYSVCHARPKVFYSRSKSNHFFCCQSHGYL